MVYDAYESSILLLLDLLQ